jgi:hypothetical protein
LTNRHFILRSNTRSYEDRSFNNRLCLCLPCALSPVLAQQKPAAAAAPQHGRGYVGKQDRADLFRRISRRQDRYRAFHLVVTNLNREFQPRQTELQALQQKIQPE